jgi:pyruvate kinase
MKNIAKTKVIATIGPSSWDEKTLREMFKNGMQIARINASFADEEEIKRVSEIIRNISPRIALLLDTQGTKIRIVGLNSEIELKDTITIISENIQSLGEDLIRVSYPNLHKELVIGTRILLDDGTIELKVSSIEGNKIHCTVTQPGVLKPNKTVNIPKLNLTFPTLTEKDKVDIQYAIENDFDFLCISFVRNAEDVRNVRNMLGDKNIKIISKIENQEGVDNFDKILEITDGIMIARGDLGVETPLEDVPILQKQMIYKCRAKGKPVIVATQMLESMRDNIQPTRAEVSDVANAVMDGTDALMLSAETSTGKYPVEAIETMNRIALSAERHMQMTPIYGKTSASYEVDEVAKNVCFLSNSIPLNGIAIFSDKDGTIGSISRHRPNTTLWSISTSLKRIRQDSIYRGVKTLFLQDLSDDRDESIQKAIQAIYTHGELDLTNKIAIISGSSIKHQRKDLILEIVTIKDVLNS